MPLKIIGAGFGRTGTRSLKAALEELGFVKCYHLLEVIKHPGHFALWADIAEGGTPDWESLFQGYQAVLDWPAASFYKELVAAYPDAKVILSLRDPEDWHQNVLTSLYQSSKISGGWLRILPFSLYRFLKALNKLIWQDTFHGKFEDMAYTIGVFNQHIKEVKSSVPRDRLLIFDARQGWEPLCAFLGVPVPEGKPFPQPVNEGASLRRIFQIGKILPWVVLVYEIVKISLLLGTGVLLAHLR
jgi:hypothetical protein